MFTSEAYKLQNNTTIDGHIITAGKLVFKEQYICSMQEITNWFWDKYPQQKVITVPTRTIIHPRLYVILITYINDITRSVCNRTQEENPYQYILFV